MRHYYHRPEWKGFRKGILERDGWHCQHCGRTARDKATLQVHHTEYFPGLLPWEHPPKVCITLCKGCHAVEHGKVFPWSGWSLESEDDLGDLTGSCDLCDTSIRYEFHITHPKWFPLVVGTDCCDKLTESDAASLIVREGKRVTRFIASSRWKTTARGIGIRQMTMDFEIVSEATAHFILFDGIRGKVSYATLENAKIGLFDFVESGEAAEFLKKRRAKQSRPRTVKMQDRGISPC